jgi:hypothetical protein
VRSIKLVLGLGFVSWLVPFAVSVLVFPLKAQETPLFDNIMAAVLTATAVLLGCRLVRIQGIRSPAVGAAVGIAWWAINIGCDLLLFSWGPMKMSPASYLKDIGLAYNAYPIILTGLVAISRVAGERAGARAR